MIKTIIFDFGDVFINLDKEGAMSNALNIFNMKRLDEEMTMINSHYEKGFISTNDFITFYLEKFPSLSRKDIKNIWNYIIKDFPEYRLEFLKSIASKNNFNLMLLSNTNELHISFVKDQVPFYNDFKNQFDKFYLSHEIQLRKPERSIYEFVLNQNKLNPNECLFIDDTYENVETAKQLGIKTWHIDPTVDDIIHLFETCKSLFEHV